MTGPKEVANWDMAFGGRAMELLPPMAEIPDEFDSWLNPWNKLANRWFGQGLPSSTEFALREGIDRNLMLRHIQTCLRSWEPKHEHKTAGVAYLLSQWCSEVRIDGEQVAP